MIGSASDTQLVARYRAGEQAAFDEIHRRYENRLERFAQRILGKQSDNAEDVVQEAMFRAARALRRDDRHIELKPWLFRLTRNTALDEISRVRTDSMPLDDAEDFGALRAAPSTEPVQAYERREGMRDLLDDLSTLPEAQRHALVRREVDGLSHAQVAAELGLTEQATKSLVFRARSNLIKERDARTAECPIVQRQLLEAAAEHRRAPVSALRHVARCPVCREFRRQLKLTDRAVALLSPGPLLLAGITLGGGLTLAGKGAGVKAAVATTASVATVGAVALGTTVFGPGDPAPLEVRSPAVQSGVLPSGEKLPAGTAVIRQELELAEGNVRDRSTTLRCPEGTRVADLLPPEGARLAVTYAPGTAVGESRDARIVFAPATLDRPTRVTVFMLCKRPDAGGSLRAPGQSALERPTHRVVADEELVRAEPSAGAEVVGEVRRGEPVEAVGEARQGWLRVVTEAGARGWVRDDALGRAQP